MTEGEGISSTFGVPMSGLLRGLMLLQLLVAGLAAAEPVIVTEEAGGSWVYDFSDDEGVEYCDNVMVGCGHAQLLPLVDGTSWEKKGVAVANGDRYDYFYAKTPCVIKENGVYRMWYSGMTDMRNRILYAESTDGINWEKRDDPVLSMGFYGEPDDYTVTFPKVIKDGPTYRMWYVGNDSVNEWAMYATSSDGITWTKRGTVFDETGIRPCTVMKEEGIFKMWYQYMVGGHWTIHYAESTTGTEWNKRSMVLDIGQPGELDDMHISGAVVVKDTDNIYRMWYAGHDEEFGYRIFYATSTDEVNWVRHGLAIDRGDSGDDDQGGVSYPCVMKDEDGYYKIWYSGVFDGWDIEIMLAVNSPTFKKDGCLRTVEIPLLQDQTWKDLNIEKTEQGKNNYIQISVLDGATDEPIPGFENLEGTSIDISSIDIATYPTIKLLVTFTGDGMTSPELDGLGASWQSTSPVEAETPPVISADNLWSGPSIAVAAVMGAAIFSLGFAGGTEIGKYRLIPLISPLYTRLKKEEVLDQLTRDRIYEYIMVNPGDHYNSIKLKLNLKNGTLTYHLRTLERENFIKSMRDGMYKRFYPVGTKIPRINGFSLLSIQGHIMELIVHHPGLSQRDISDLLEASQQLVSYHVNHMIKERMLRSDSKDGVLRYFIAENYL